MKEPNKQTIVLEFTSEEYEILKRANAFTGLSENSFLRILIQEALNKNLRKKNTQFVILKFPISDNMKPEEIVFKKWIKISQKDFEELSAFSKYTGIKNSSLVKKWIMPMSQRIILKKGWEVNI